MYSYPYPYTQGIIHPRLKVVTQPSVEPVTTDEAKAWTRVEINEDDTLIGGMITSARMLLENRLSRAFVTTQFKYTLDYFGNSQSWAWPLKLPVAEVQGVDSIVYRDTAGNSTTLDTALYSVSAGSPGYVQPVPGSVWPATSPWITGAVEITFTAGYGDDATSVPETVKTAIKMLVASWYGQREHLLLGSIVAKLPDYVDALLDRERWS